jgi:hypothetical protein
VFNNEEGGNLINPPEREKLMKCKIFWISVIIIIYYFPVICFAQQPNPKIWKPLEYNSYYNIKIITTSSDTKLIWTYKTVTNVARDKRIEEVKQYDLGRSIKYQQYSHEVILWEIDCKNRQWRLKDIIDFNKDEKVLDRYSFNNSAWEVIMPNSMMDFLYQKVCVTPKIPLKKKKRF